MKFNSHLINIYIFIESFNNLIEKKILDEKLRVGLGLVFHITHSNVPINFCALRIFPTAADFLAIIF